MTLTDVSNMSLNDRLATSPGTETKSMMFRSVEINRTKIQGLRLGL